MNERLSKMFSNPWTVPVAVGVTAFGSGLGLGYILGRRQAVEIHEIPQQLELDFHVEDLAEIRNIPTSSPNVTQIEVTESEALEIVVTDSKAFDVVMNETIDSNVNEFVATKIKEAMVSHQMSEPEEVRVVTQNVFTDSEDDWDYEEELKHRTEIEPYIIHRDEFWAEELNYTQTTLTYYEGDDIMADEDDKPVYNYKTVTGPLRFGHGSSDPNVFHVRNDKRKAEYEILRHDGLFSVEVLGLEIENNERARDIKHSNNRKFRLE